MIGLFTHINDIQSLKLRKLYDQSNSLKIQKKKRGGDSRFDSLVDDFGFDNKVEDHEEDYLNGCSPLAKKVGDAADDFMRTLKVKGILKSPTKYRDSPVQDYMDEESPKLPLNYTKEHLDLMMQQKLDARN